MNNEFFEQLISTDEYKENPLLLLVELPKAQHLISMKPALPNKDVYFIGSVGKDISVNQTFDVIFAKKDPTNYIQIDSRLKLVNVRPSDEITTLYGGMSGLCLVEFSQGIPELLKKLKPFEETYKNEAYDILYLTTQALMDKIIELLD